ncbi:hypothetical protein L1887_17769 [Cichorium endivia]|nr:hypothetical protein L1887_17769 [Cichorium endivia]
MEGLMDPQLALIHMVMWSYADDYRRPPSPLVPDLHKVKLFVLHQDSWWDRLQVGIAGLDRKRTTTIIVLQSGHLDLIPVVPSRHDDSTIRTTSIFTISHLHLHLVTSVVGTLSHLMDSLKVDDLAAHTHFFKFKDEVIKTWQLQRHLTTAILSCHAPAMRFLGDTHDDKAKFLGNRNA